MTRINAPCSPCPLKDRLRRSMGRMTESCSFQPFVCLARKTTRGRFRSFALLHNHAAVRQAEIGQEWTFIEKSDSYPPTGSRSVPRIEARAARLNDWRHWFLHGCNQKLTQILPAGFVRRTCEPAPAGGLFHRHTVGKARHNSARYPPMRGGLPLRPPGPLDRCSTFFHAGPE